MSNLTSHLFIVIPKEHQSSFIVKECHPNIQRLINAGWLKNNKKNDYYIFLEKDGVVAKVAIATGKIVSEEKIVKEEKP